MRAAVVGPAETPPRPRTTARRVLAPAAVAVALMAGGLATWLALSAGHRAAQPRALSADPAPARATPRPSPGAPALGTPSAAHLPAPRAGMPSRTDLRRHTGPRGPAPARTGARERRGALPPASDPQAYQGAGGVLP